MIGSGCLFKCVFGYFGAYLIDLKANGAISKVESGSILAATFGYLVSCVLTRLIADQSKVLNTLSLNSVPFTVEIAIFVFFVPWVIAAAIHESLFVVQTYCLLGMTLTLFICYLLPFKLWMD